MKIAIQTEDFDVSTELILLRKDLPSIGGINIFVGTVRDTHQGDDVHAMELEHYPGMTEKSLKDSKTLGNFERNNYSSGW